jgi:hypothetical protein
VSEEPVEVGTEFRRSRHGEISMKLDETEVRILRHVLKETLELLGPEDAGGEDDPLAAAVGIGTATKPPEDTALARLFPDGYSDDPEASADFRRYTEPGLRDAKREAARIALATLEHPGHRRVLTEEEALAWLGTLNDMRLVLGDRLGITEDWDELVESLEQDDPRLMMFWVYDRLTYLQEMLVRALR